MIKFIQKKRGTKIPYHDFILEKEDFLLQLLDTLTPKLEGIWTVALVEPTIKFMHDFIDENRDVKFIEINVYISSNRLDTILLKHPKLVPVKLTAKEEYINVLSTLANTLEHNASTYLYKACDGNVETISEALINLDNSNKTGTITLDDVKEVCMYIRKPLYASKVYTAFLRKDKNRWKLLEQLEKDLGTNFAYNALKKQAGKWIKDKAAYLSNEDTKNWNVSSVDGLFIAYAYLCFYNSNRPEELFLIMHDIDNRNKDSLERRLNVNL